MRVGIVGLQHESNTFSPLKTRLSDFDISVGEEIAESWSGTHHEVAGFLAGLAAERIQAVPVFMATATPSGVIEDDALDALLSSMQMALARAGDLDGVIVAAHGAAVAEGHAGIDGHWLALIRRWVGPSVPLICTLDLHANLSRRMIDSCNAVIGYRSNPHLDQMDRGIEAATLMARVLRREVNPVVAASFPPVAINILAQDTSAEPCARLCELAESLRHECGVLSVSVLLGFPYADVEEMGSSFVVVTNGDAELANSAAEELASYLVTHRDEYLPKVISPQAALDKASAVKDRVCLLDTGDNVGGGAPGDGTTIAHIVHERGGPKSFVSIFDPESVQLAGDAGVGTSLRLRIGGKTDALHGSPLEVDVRIRSEHTGRFIDTAVRHGGRTSYDMGRTLIAETDGGLTIQLTSRRIPPFSLNQIESCDIDPRSFQVLAAKGVHAPVPAYANVCPLLARVNTPGCTTPDMRRLDFQHRRRPLFPFEELPDDKDCS